MKNRNCWRLASCALFLVSASAAWAGINSWSNVGPEGVSINAVAVDPTNPARVFAGTYSRGVFKSDDRGAHWAAVNTGLPDFTALPVDGMLVVDALAIDPQNPATIYAATKSYSYPPAQAGVYKTIDGGAHWNAINAGITDLNVLALAIDPKAPQTLYAGGTGGSFKTTDGGSDWSPLSPDSGDGSVLAIDPLMTSTIYAAGNSGVHKSTDGGATWAGANTGLSGPVVGMFVDPVNSGTLYASNTGGVFKSTDAGAHWSATSLDPLLEVFALVVDPIAPETVYAGTKSLQSAHADQVGGLLKTTNGGATWALLNTGLSSVEIAALAVDPASPGRVYAGTAGGVFTTTDGAVHWTAANVGLGHPQVNSLAVDPTTLGALYVSTGYGVFETTNGGNSWAAMNGDLTDYVYVLAMDPTTPKTLYAGGLYGFWKTTDGGRHWTRGVNRTGASALAIDPGPPTTVYAGGYAIPFTYGFFGGGLLKTTDGGAHWHDVDVFGSSYPIPFGGHLNPSITALAIDASAPGTVYASNLDRGGIKTRDGGATWTDLEIGVFLALVVDPDNPAVLYAGTPAGGILKATHCGSGWAAMNAGLTDLHVAALAIDQHSPMTVYAGTHSGVFQTTDGGAHWVAMNTGLDDLNVLALGINPHDSTTLYAGTSGGLFAFTIASSTLSLDDLPNDARFEVKVHYETAQAGGLSGDGTAIPLAGLGVEHGGLFWLFDPSNPEMLVKMINGCGVNGKHWFFSSAVTNVGMTLTVRDTQSGEVRTYSNPDLTPAAPIEDTAAFDCGEQSADSGATPLVASHERHQLPSLPGSFLDLPSATGCTSNATTLCVADRFRIQITYATSQAGGLSGMGNAIPLDSLDVTRGGLFWFFGADNPEMLIKVIDACSLNNKFWIFYSAGTNVGFTVTATDTLIGHSHSYTNTDLQAARPIQDTAALDCE